MDAFSHLFSLSFAFFILMDPIGNVPLFAPILKQFPPKRQKQIILREMSIALFVMVLFYFLGEWLLNILLVEKPTLMVTGGLILFLIAIKMIFPSREEKGPIRLEKEEPFIVPLAIPLIAGPAILAAIIFYSHEEASTLLTLGAIGISWLASLAILLSSSLLKRILGDRILSGCEKLMGLLLTLIAVQMFLEGLNLFLKV